MPLHKATAESITPPPPPLSDETGSRVEWKLLKGKFLAYRNLLPATNLQVYKREHKQMLNVADWTHCHRAQWFFTGLTGWNKRVQWSQCGVFSHTTWITTEKKRLWTINNVEYQLDATITIYWHSNQLNMFRAIFCPSSGAQDCVLQLVV